LRFHIAQLHRAAPLDEPIRQGGFAMINMSDDGEITNV
jgi:hypothetical protein